MGNDMAGYGDEIFWLEFFPLDSMSSSQESIDL